MTDVIPTRSGPLRKALVLALALPLASASVLPALAQDAGMQMHHKMGADGGGDRGDDRGRMDRGYRHGDRDMDRGRGMDRDRDFHRWHGPSFAERLAIKLAGAETAAGIKSSQLDAWRTFTAALVDFSTFQRPSMMDRDQAGGEDEMDDEAMAPADDQQAAAPDATEAAPTAPPPATGPDAAPDRAGRSGMDFLDRLIARAETRAEKAAKLKAAKTQLETVLEPGQREIIERFLMPRGFGMCR